MFYVPRNYNGYNPYYAPSPAQVYAEPDADDIARARYLRALREQRAARQAYADSLAERELRRLEQTEGLPRGHAYNPRQRPHSYYAQDPYTEYDYDDQDRYDALREARAAEIQRQRAAALEERRRAAEHAQEERRRAAEAQAAAVEEERRRRIRAYKQAQAYAEAAQQERLKPSHRKLGRVTPDVRPNSKPVRVEIHSASAPAPTPAQQTTPLPRSRSPSPPKVAKTPLETIADIEDSLEHLISAFALPDNLEFRAPFELTYASHNAPVRAQEFALGGLLEKLDAVESAGDEEVRAARKHVVARVEKAMDDLDAAVRDAWRKAHPGEPEPVPVSPVVEEEELMVDDGSDLEYVDENDLSESPVPAAASEQDIEVPVHDEVAETLSTSTDSAVELSTADTAEVDAPVSVLVEEPALSSSTSVVSTPPSLPASPQIVVSVFEDAEREPGDMEVEHAVTVDDVDMSSAVPVPPAAEAHPSTSPASPVAQPASLAPQSSGSEEQSYPPIDRETTESPVVVEPALVEVEQSNAADYPPRTSVAEQLDYEML